MGQNLREGDVRALGKERMTLQRGAELFEIDRAGVADEKHRVRIAHADGAKTLRRARDSRLERDVACVANVARQRNSDQARRGRPMSTVNSVSPARQLSTRPASVSMRRCSGPPPCASAQATQRVPLPQAAESEPSML